MLNNIVTSAAMPKAGLCPHGLPPSACPICSNMGGGGGRRVEMNFKSAAPQMMSWNRCEAIGFFLKGLRRGAERRHEGFKELALQLQFQADKFSKLATRLEQLTMMLNQSFVGSFVALPIKVFLLPSVRVLQNSFSKCVDITDKIAAIIGELKKGLEKAKENLAKFVKELKNKFFRLFGVFRTQNEDEMDKQLDEEKRIFNINKFFKIFVRKRSRDKNET